jgi:hypothetical protein
MALLLRTKTPEESVSMLAVRTSVRCWWVPVGLGLACLAGACTSRTLPLPPPDVEPLAPPDPQGLVLVQGTAHSGASIGVLNERSQLGLIGAADDSNCDSTCPFKLQIEAKSGDPIRVWQFYTTPPSTDLRVPK